MKTLLLIPKIWSECIALLGYEIVEGRLDDGRIHELRRVSYAPQS